MTKATIEKPGEPMRGERHMHVGGKTAEAPTRAEPEKKAKGAQKKPRRGTERTARVAKASGGLLIDYNPDGKPIGIEITAPERVSLPVLNRVLTRLGQPRVRAEELAPLLAA